MTTLLAGKYRIERIIGQGGMGVVVSAVHTALDERVAIKFLLPEALASAETVARFQREARAAVRIKSEHIARVIDVGTIDAAALPIQHALGVPMVVDAPFMVMEYLEGQDLSGVIRTAGPLSVSDAVTYVLQAIEAIAEAHSLGIIHRDLKPSNLFLTRRPDGTALVKVLDFGISKAVNPALGDIAMTTTTAVLGSPMYMAPEQMIASREVDGRTDIWALGVVLYQVLTGRGPFNGTTMAELCARILQEPHAPIRQVRADVPAAIEAAVARCLEKERTHRFASVADLAEALAPFGGAGASLSAERARRLIPRTERAPRIDHHVSHERSDAPALPYAATNPSWSATRGRSGAGSTLWIFLALSLAAIVTAAAVVVFVIAAKARVATRASAIADTDHGAPPPVMIAAPSASSIELAPLHVESTTTTTSTSVRRSPPPPRATASEAPTSPPTNESPPLVRPDIF